MRESAGLELKRASESVELFHEIRGLLKKAAKGIPDSPEEVGSTVSRIDEIVADAPDPNATEEWRVMAAGLRVLVSQANSLEIAQGGEGDLLNERARLEILTEDWQRKLSSESLVLPDNVASMCEAILQTGASETERLCSFLLAIPLPTLFRKKEEEKAPYQRPQNGMEQPNLPPLVRIIAFLDGIPFASPKHVKPGERYSLSFQARGLEWPREAVRFRLEMLTTCPASEYVISEFALDPPEQSANGEYQGEIPGTIKFNSGQSNVFDDTAFAVHGAFETADGNILEAPVIGLHDLRFKVLDDEKWPKGRGNGPQDKHILELVTQLCEDCPNVREELTDLQSMLDALTNLLAIYAQGAIFKGANDVSEREFHATVLHDLRGMLGQDVQEHTSQAGGVTDIRYLGVIVELKVEKRNGDREYIVRKYTAQPTQYASVESKQVSILLVLDLTTKDKPPGDIRNDIILVDVETHGGDDSVKKYPSKAFVFVINGNMKSPSDYSR